jgi:hypothetical protein
MPSWMAWVMEPSGPIKMEERASALKEDNVSWKQTTILDVNHYHIIRQSC